MNYYGSFESSVWEGGRERGREGGKDGERERRREGRREEQLDWWVPLPSSLLEEVRGQWREEAVVGQITSRGIW